MKIGDKILLELFVESITDKGDCKDITFTHPRGKPFYRQITLDERDVDTIERKNNG